MSFGVQTILPLSVRVHDSHTSPGHPDWTNANEGETSQQQGVVGKIRLLWLD
jgi:hypothetical protein